MNARSLAYRLLCKAWELLLRGATRLRVGFPSDPTTILLDNMTTAQRQAEGPKSLQLTSPKVAARLLVVIPFRDRWDLTSACLHSLLSQTLGSVQGRILLVDNGSTSTEAKAGIADALGKAPPPGWSIDCLRADEPFNYSRLNNKAVGASAGFRADWLLFLNNDVELREPDDLATLVAFAQACPALGALGCTLVYPDERIQHLFLAPGVKIVGAHPFKGWQLDPNCAWFREPRPVPAVTGAVLLVAREKFEAVGGFDEELSVVGQDLDLCLKLQKTGYVNWTLASLRAVHKEGATRGFAFPKDEVRKIYQRWGTTLIRNPYYSDRFSRFSETPIYGPAAPSYPWDKVLP